MNNTATRRLVAIILGSIISTQISAQEVACDETIIFYGNGVTSLPEDREKSIVRLKEELKKNLLEVEFAKLEFQIANNSTNGVVSDLLEAGLQDFQTDYSSFYRAVAGVDILPDWFQEASRLLQRPVSYRYC